METGDELRFSLAGGALCGAYLRVPEEDLRLIRGNPLAGVRRIDACQLVLKSERPFILPETRFRYFESSGEVLLALNEGFSIEAVDLCLGVAQGLDLLSTRGVYCGWTLPRPVQASGAKCGEAQRAANLVVEYFALVNSKTMDRLYESDRELEARLKDLLRRAQVSDAAGVIGELQQSIEKILDKWF